jgi:hypothetical protein
MGKSFTRALLCFEPGEDVASHSFRKERGKNGAPPFWLYLTIFSFLGWTEVPIAGVGVRG